MKQKKDIFLEKKYNILDFFKKKIKNKFIFM